MDYVIAAYVIGGGILIGASISTLRALQKLRSSAQYDGAKPRSNYDSASVN